MKRTMLASAVLTFAGLSPLSAVAQIGPNNIITTVAGAAWTFPGDGKPARSAPISQVRSLNTDTNGNIIFADPGNHVVSRLNANGTITVLAGNGVRGFSGEDGPARNASFNNPIDAVMDNNGNLYVSDSFNETIRLVTTDGVISSYVVNVSEARLALDNNNSLYFTAPSECLIYRYTTDLVLTKVAGNGVCGHSGDGGSSLQARISPFGGLAFDGAGNLYLAEGYYIRRITPDGTITTIAGTGVAGAAGDNGPAVSATMNYADSLVFDSTGNLFVSDVNNSVVRQISSDGTITTAAGSYLHGFLGDGGSAAKAVLFFPQGLAIDGSGNLHLADSGNFRIRRISGGIIDTVAGDGRFRVVTDGTPQTQAFLFGPNGLAFDSSGNMLITEVSHNQVAQISPSGSFSVIAGTGTQGASFTVGIAAKQALLDTPARIVADQQGNIYVSDDSANVVYKIGPDGKLLVFAGQIFKDGNSGDNGPATNATLSSPYDLALDSAGNLYVSDYASQVVRRVSTDGIITTVAGTGKAGYSGDDGSATSAMLSRPSGIAFDPSGNLLICDRRNNRIRMVDASGKITTVAGDGKAASTGDGGRASQASLNSPFSIAVDSSGNIYFLEPGRIRSIDTTGVISTIGGSDTQTNSGDGGPVGQASLDIDGLAFDSAGNLFLASYDSDTIRKILVSEPVFTTSTTTLSFSGASGGAPADPQTVAIGGALTGLQFTVTSDRPWLQALNYQGSTPFNLTVLADPGSLVSGSYQGTLSLTRPGAANPFARIAVTFTVGPALPPKLAVQPAALQISVTQSGAQQTQSFRVLNAGSGSLNFSVVPSGAATASIGLSARSGIALAGTPQALVVTVDPATLPAGTFAASLRVASGTTGETVNIPLTISVAPRPQRMAISQRGLLFTAVQGGGVTPPQSLSVLNIGTGSFTWSASPILLSGGPTWLSVTPGSGSTPAGSSTGQVTVSVDPTLLPSPGVYYGLVRISSTGATNAPQDAEVVLNLLPSGSNPEAVLTPAGLVFTSVARAQNPSSQVFTITNLNATPLQFYVNTGAFGLSWLQAAPNTATIPAGGTQPITVQPSLDGLEAGVYRGTLTMQFQAPAAPGQFIGPQLVNVLLVVTPAAGGGAKSGHSTVGCTPSQLLPLFTSLPPSFAVPASWPMPLEARVLDDCGTPQTTGGVVVTFDNGDPALAMLSLNDGRWQATWYGKNSNAKTFSVHLSADQPSPKLSAAVKYTATLQANNSIPAVTAGGVGSAGVAPPQAALAPGSIISIAGESLSAGQSSANKLPLTTNLGGTQVLLAGRLLPLMYSSGGRISALVPYDVDVNAQYTLAVGRGSAISGTEMVAVGAAQPAVFLVDASGDAKTPQNLWTQLTAGTPIDPSRMAPTSPVKAGDHLVVYCTGLGAVEGTQDVSMPAPSNPPKLMNPVSLTLGSVTVQPTFAGLVPGLTGIYQVQLTVPAGIAPGDGIPLTLSVLGQTSVPVNLSVR